MSHHPTETSKQHLLQVAVLIFGIIIWFMPIPSGLEAFIAKLPSSDLEFTAQTSWHLFAIFISAIFAVILKAMPIFT